MECGDAARHRGSDATGGRSSRSAVVPPVPGVPGGRPDGTRGGVLVAAPVAAPATVPRPNTVARMLPPTTAPRDADQRQRAPLLGCGRRVGDRVAVSLRFAVMVSTPVSVLSVLSVLSVRLMRSPVSARPG